MLETPVSPSDRSHARPRSGFGCVEDELLRRYLDRGDLAAREELVARMRPLIRRLARRYRHSAALEDLEQVAALGLTKALARFDPARGGDLIRYAVPTMAGELRRWLRDHAWAVRPPREAAEASLEVGAAVDRLGAQLGHVPTAVELAAHLQLPLERVQAGLEARRLRHSVSLEAPLRGDERRTLADGLGGDDGDLLRAFDRTWLAGLSEPLTELERAVLELYYSDDLSQREIAARLGLSQMKVCRLLGGALDQLRAADLAAEPAFAA